MWPGAEPTWADHWAMTKTAVALLLAVALASLALMTWCTWALGQSMADARSEAVAGLAPYTGTCEGMSANAPKCQ